MSDGGKGSSRRPTDDERFRENWQKIFGNKTVDTVGPDGVVRRQYKPIEPKDFVQAEPSQYGSEELQAQILEKLEQKSGKR
jgi:hypothetical protein